MSLFYELLGKTTLTFILTAILYAIWLHFEAVALIIVFILIYTILDAITIYFKARDKQ